MDLETFITATVSWATTNGVKLIIGLILLFIGLKVIKRFMKHFDRLLEKRNVDATLQSFLRRFTSIGLKALLFIVLMGYVGIPTTAFTALIASAGLAVGLALQGSLSNFAGGVILLLLRPFKLGDYIQTPEYSGTVEDIRIFYTQLVTPDNKLILIPNGPLANGSVINYSAKELRRVDLVFGVSYDSNMREVKEILIEVIKAHPLILDDPAPFVSISEHAASSVNFVVRVWCKNADYWSIYFDLLEQVKEAFDQKGIEIPFPQLDVHTKN